MTKTYTTVKTPGGFYVRLGIDLKLTTVTRQLSSFASVLLASATSWYSSKDGGGQEIDNRNDAGADPAVTGSSNVNTTNDPTFLEHTGEDYVWLPGTSGNGVYAASITGLAGVDDLDLQVDVALPTYTPAGNEHLLGKWETSVTKEYILTLDSGGELILFHSTNGTTSITVGSGAAVPAADGERIQLRATRNGTELKFWYRSTSDDSWTQLGATQTITADSFYSSGSELSLGGIYSHGSDALATAGKYYSASVTSGATTESWVPEAWTIRRSATGLKTAVVTRPVYVFDGTDDYLQLPAADTPTFTATTGKHTIVVAYRPHTVAGTNETIYSAEGAASDGLWIRRAASGIPTVRVGDGATNVNASAVVADTDSVFSVIAAVVDDGRATVYKHGVGLVNTEVFSALGTITHSAPRISSRAYSVTSFYSDEVFDVLSFPGTALTETELDAIAAKLIAGTYSAD